MSALFDKAIRPDRAPLFVNAVGTADGEVWLERFVLDDVGPREFLVVNGSGRAIATVQLPRRFELHQAGMDFVLGVQRADDGVETVIELPVSRATRH